MSFYQTKLTPRGYQAPFLPLAEAHAAYGRLTKLITLIPDIRETQDDQALLAAIEEAQQLAHQTMHDADHATELASRPEAQDFKDMVLRDAVTISALARTEIAQAVLNTNNTPSSTPDRQQLHAARALLRSATDDSAVYALHNMVRNHPERPIQNDAAVNLAQRIRDDNAIRNQFRPSSDLPTAQISYDGAAGQLLNDLAAHGVMICKAQEAGIICTHNRNMRYEVSTEVSAHTEAAQKADELLVTPNIYHHLSVQNDDKQTHMVIFQHFGAKYAKTIWEPYPPVFPAQLAIEQMNSVIHSQAFASPDETGPGHQAFVMAKAALMDLHDIQRNSLYSLIDNAGNNAPNTLLVLSSGDLDVARMLSRQAGIPVPDDLPNHETTGRQRALDTIEKTISSMAAMTANARWNQPDARQ